MPIPGAAVAQGELEGIRVEVEGTGFADRTDPSGVFAVRGAYGGPIALRFRRDDGIDARLLADVPFGGVITLSNVRLRSASGDATAERHEVDFEGVVTGTNCPADTITVRAGDGRVYTVHLNGTLRADDGTPIGCGTLSGGEEIEIEGVVNPDGTIDAFEAELENDSSGSGGGDGDDDSSGSDDDDSSGSGGGDD